jgi:hypothetical protein
MPELFEIAMGDKPVHVPYPPRTVHNGSTAGVITYCTDPASDGIYAVEGSIGPHESRTFQTGVWLRLAEDIWTDAPTPSAIPSEIGISLAWAHADQLRQHPPTSIYPVVALP